MGLLCSGFLSLFFSSLLCVSFVSCAIGYCLLLLLGMLGLGGFLYLSVGCSWYLLLFGIVYVGGVFILLIYVSSLRANWFSWLSCGVWLWYGLFFFFFFFFLFSVLSGVVVFSECGHYLCMYEGSLNYCFFCLSLLLSFFLVGLISGGKDGFFR